MRTRGELVIYNFRLSSVTSIRLIICLLFVVRLAGADPLVFSEARPVPELDQLFQQKDGWIGADGDYSVALTPQRTLWLFSDTWIGSIRGGKRMNATIINNSLALEDRNGTQTNIQFIIGHDANGKATAFLTPEDKRGWFWLQSAVCVENRLYLFLAQIEKTGADNVFGFRQVGEWLGVVTNPLDPPTAWQVKQEKIPWTTFQPERQITFGAASLVVDHTLYVYGTDEDRNQAGSGDRALIVARVPINEVTNFLAWQFYANGRWDSDSHQATGMAGDMASECSVSYLPKFGQYVLVYTDRGLSPKIQVRTAPTPWGEWSQPTTVYECPEMMRDKNVFCYSAKAHPSQGTNDRLIITYAANSFDFWQVVNDASLYWPRFVCVELATRKE